MFEMLFVPYLPVETIYEQSAPVIQVAQATARSGVPSHPGASAVKGDMVLAGCESVQGPEGPGGKLGGSMAPAGMLQNYWYERYKKVLDVSNAKVTVLEGPSRGILDAPFLHRPDGLGPTFNYAPERGYLGQDKVTFLVEVAGKRVKVISTLYVVKQVDDNNQTPCGYYVKRISGLSGSSGPLANTVDLDT